MCGIAGCLDASEANNRSGVERQVATLAHRGPDSRGVFSARGAAIGQTRLAVIDLLTGDPPLHNEDGTVGAVLNGEIYNFKDLRAELRSRGHQLTTAGDTEVIAHLGEDLEPIELARRLHGMFAFAVWDDRRQRLVLGRDRLGKKPLYYWTSGDRVVFGSEIKAVLAHPAVPRRVDPTVIPSYLAFGYVPTPATFYDGIRSVPPGHVLVAGPGAEPRLQPYWTATVPPDAGPVHDISLPEAGRRIRELLGTAVERRLVADVPLGAFLSGGIDSSAIVGLMAERMTQPVRTFTIGFEDSQGYDERPYAAAVARRFATDHTEFVVSPSAVDLVERLVWHHDQPFGDSSAVPTFLLSELTRAHVTVALSGDGGDELFAGYERFSAAMALARWPVAAGRMARLVGPGLDVLPRRRLQGRVGSAQRFARAAAQGLPDALLEWAGVAPPATREALVGSHGEDWGVADYRARWEASAGAHPLHRLLLLNLNTYLVDDLLPKADRMSMAHGLEVRSPFLDHELVEFALRLPPRVQLRGFSRKLALNEAARDLVPDEIINRRKRGFGVPLDRWFRTDLRTFVDSRLGVPDARVRSYLEPAAIDTLLQEHAADVADHGQLLWTLLTLELFLRREEA